MTLGLLNHVVNHSEKIINPSTREADSIYHKSGMDILFTVTFYLLSRGSARGSGMQ